jgi:hypothetical protein
MSEMRGKILATDARWAGLVRLLPQAANLLMIHAAYPVSFHIGIAVHVAK